jgi:hypothetical protein
MLYFGARDSLALDRLQAGIRGQLEQELDAPVTIYTESFDKEGLGRSPLYAVAMEQFLREKYAECRLSCWEQAVRSCCVCG